MEIPFWRLKECNAEAQRRRELELVQSRRWIFYKDLEFELDLALELYPLLWVWKYPFGG